MAGTSNELFYLNPIIIVFTLLLPCLCFIFKDWQSQIASSILPHSAFLTTHKMLLVHLAKARPKTLSKHTENDLAIQVKKIVCMLAINARNVLSWQYFKQHIASYDPVKYTVAGGASQVHFLWHRARFVLKTAPEK